MIPKDNGCRFAYINGKIIDTYTESIEIDFERADSVRIYEVVHITDGNIVCLREHYKRLVKSSKMTGVQGIPSYEDIRNQALKLCNLNNKIYGDFKLICTQNDENCDKLLYFNVYNISSECSASKEKGIDTTVFEWERIDPNAKVGRNDYISAVNECKARNPKSFELILKNKKGCLTEGSMSNFYAIKGNTLYTSPKSEVLQGCMRLIVLNICRKLGIKICYRSPKESDVKEKFDAAFISSTPVNILPIRSIDGKFINSAENPVLLKIMNEFDIMIKMHEE